METRANHVLIGVFTLAVIGLAFGFVWWFAGAADTSSRKIYQVVFQGSISGLTRGSGVMFNGIRVGEVTNLSLDSVDPKKVRARIAVEATTPVRTDTKARLEYQGLTGVAAIQLEGGLTSAPPLESTNDEPPVIVAERSAVQDLLEGARRVMSRADEILATVEGFVQEARGPLTGSIEHVERFTQALADNAGNVDAFLAATGDAASRIGQLADQLTRIVEAVNPEEIDTIVRNARQFSDGLATAGPKIDTIFTDAAEIASELRSVASRLDTTFTRANEIVQAVEPAQVRQAVDGVASFAQTLERNRGEVDIIVRDVREMVARLNQASTRIDGVINGVESLVGGNEGGGLQEFADTARAIRELAVKLDERTDLLTRDISGFTGRSSREISALASQGARTLVEIERVMREFESNPQRFLFGGSTIPDYSPRR